MNNCWISTSLFGDKCAWPIMLKTGIRPILSELAINNFRVRLNFLGGSNIQLALQVNTYQAEVIARKLDNYFRVFFSRQPSSKHSPTFGQSLFISFPENSIHYGLYELDAGLEENRNSLHQLLSEIIIDSLQYDLDDASILTLAMYLHLVIIKLLSKHIRFNSQRLKLYFIEKYPSNLSKSRESEMFFLENINTFGGILEDVFFKTFSKHDCLFWITRWEEFCEDEMNKNRESLEELYQVFTLAIDKFLGINVEEKEFFNDLMCKMVCLKYDDVSESAGVLTAKPLSKAVRYKTSNE